MKWQENSKTSKFEVIRDSKTSKLEVARESKTSKLEVVRESKTSKLEVIRDSKTSVNIVNRSLHFSSGLNGGSTCLWLVSASKLCLLHSLILLL